MHATPKQARAAWSSSRTRLTPVLPALLAALARALRSRRAARPDREAPARGRAPGGGRPREPGAARAGRLQRLRAGAARDPRTAGHGEGRDHDRRAASSRRSASRSRRRFPSCTRLTPLPGARRQGQRRRHRPPRHRRGARAQHHRAREGAGLRRAVSRRRRAPQSATTRSGGWRSCPASGRGRRTTSRCARCAGRTRFRRKTSPSATISAASLRRKPTSCRSPGVRGGATPSCTSGLKRPARHPLAIAASRRRRSGPRPSSRCPGAPARRAPTARSTPPQPMALPHVRREQLAPVLEHDRAQDGALAERQPLPRLLEHRVLLGEQPARAPGADRRGSPCCRPPPARRPTFRARAAARRRAGCRRARRSPRRGPSSGLMPERANRASMNAAKLVGRNLLEPHHRPGLVERPLRRRASAPSGSAPSRRTRSRPRADAGRRRAARARRCRR